MISRVRYSFDFRAFHEFDFPSKNIEAARQEVKNKTGQQPIYICLKQKAIELKKVKAYAN